MYVEIEDKCDEDYPYRLILSWIEFLYSTKMERDDALKRIGDTNLSIAKLKEAVEEEKKRSRHLLNVPTRHKRYNKPEP